MQPSVDDFYHAARMTLVKDETLFDRYDRAFASFYGKVAALYPKGKDIPLEWLVKEFQKKLTPEEKAALEKHGWDKLMEMFRERLEEQKERHAGGNKWIGTGEIGRASCRKEGRARCGRDWSSDVCSSDLTARWPRSTPRARTFRLNGL